MTILYGDDSLQGRLMRGNHPQGNRMECPSHTNHSSAQPKAPPHREHHARGDRVGAENPELAHFNRREMVALRQVPGLVKRETAEFPALAKKGEGGDTEVGLVNKKAAKMLDAFIHGGRKQVNPRTGLREYATFKEWLQNRHGIKENSHELVLRDIYKNLYTSYLKGEEEEERNFKNAQQRQGYDVQIGSQYEKDKIYDPEKTEYDLPKQVQRDSCLPHAMYRCLQMSDDPEDQNILQEIQKKHGDAKTIPDYVLEELGKKANLSQTQIDGDKYHIGKGGLGLDMKDQLPKWKRSHSYFSREIPKQNPELDSERTKKRSLLENLKKDQNHPEYLQNQIRIEEDPVGYRFARGRQLKRPMLGSMKKDSVEHAVVFADYSPPRPDRPYATYRTADPDEGEIAKRALTPGYHVYDEPDYQESVKTGQHKPKPLHTLEDIKALASMGEQGKKKK